MHKGPVQAATSICAVIVWIAGGQLSLQAGPEETYRDEIRPILQKHCYECHGPEEMKGDLNLTEFAEYTNVVVAPKLWQLVYERVRAYEMPPKKAKELSFNDHRTLTRWLRRLPKPEQVDCNEIASDRTTHFYRGYVMSRRLNRAEFNNTVRDLFGLNLPVDLLPADGGGGEGFDTSGEALFTSSIHIEKYLAAADRAVKATLAADPRNLAPEARKAREQILTAKPGLFTSADEAARKVLSNFARRAWRRPIQPEELERLMPVFERGWKRGDGFAPAIGLAVKAVLISPHFLFLVEPEPKEYGVQALAALPLASKLSYFIWSSMPDERLLTLAETGKLLETNVYRQEIRRMLADPKAAALGERFALQWLDLERLGTEVRPDTSKFPEFDSELGEAMRREVVTFFNHIVQSDRSLLELIDSDYTFVNERLAKLYGLEAVSGTGWQRVNLTDANRGGVLGMAAIHTVTSFPLRTSPVLRGRWVLESLLGDKVPPPPPDAPALEETAELASDLTFREQLDKHRTKAECATCHDKMDPLGFGLENFDVLGRWRETDREQPIDNKGVLPSGQSFTGPTGLKEVLKARKDDIMRHLARKVTGFAFGRELNDFDQCVVDNAMKALCENNYRAGVLIEQIATSFQFKHRFYPKPD